MAKKIYVANLPPSTTEDEVCELFGDFGTVEWVHLVKAVDTGRPRGTGYVAMADGAGKAIRRLDHRRLGDRLLRVRRALPPGSGYAVRPRVPKRARTYRAEARWAVASMA